MARTKKTDVTISVGGDDLIETPPGFDHQPPPASGGPSMVEVEINGAKYLVPAESAAAIQAQQEATASQFDSLKTELETIRRAPPSVAAPPVQPVVEDTFDNDLFINPRGTMNKFKDEVKEEMRREYTLEQQRAKFWSDFYGTNKHLEGSNVVVEAVMHKYMSELAALPVDKQSAALAEKVEAELSKIVKTRSASAPPRESARPVEGGSAVQGGPGQAPATDAFPEDRVVSITEIQRNMRKRRLDARTGRASA
jgi:hypothetical protein